MRPLIDPPWGTAERYPLKRWVVGTLWINRKIKQGTQAQRDAYAEMLRCWKKLREAFRDGNWRGFDHWYKEFTIAIRDAREAYVLPLAQKSEIFSNAGGQAAADKESKNLEVVRRALEAIAPKRDRKSIHAWIIKNCGVTILLETIGKHRATIENEK